MDAVTVLVVEDDDSARKLMTIFIQRCGYRVEAAANGAEALDAVARRRPDLVVTDLNMPGVDGHELIRQLRADPVTARLPVVVVSAAWPPSGASSSDVAGADAFLAKPIDLGGLSDTVERLLAGAASGA